MNTLTFQSTTIDSDRLLAGLFPKKVIELGHIINIIGRLNKNIAAYIFMLLLTISIKRKVRDDEQNFYQKGRISKHRVNGKSFFTYSYGIGPKILFLHGFCSKGARWRRYTNQLVSRGFEVIIVDAPAHGNSKGLVLSIPDYVDIVAYLLNHHQNIHTIVSHSIGALAATFGLSKSKSKQDPCKLILMSSFSSLEQIMTRFSKLFEVDEQITDTVRKLSHTYLGNHISSFDMHSHLRNLNCKLLVISDKYDPLVPLVETFSIAQSLKTAEIFVTEHLGHGLHSKEVESRVIEFISRQD
jgi:pimeloyl-ACP methyl ester carboxylesterase